MEFSSFNFEKEVVEGLEAMGFKEATPVQEKAIPIILEGKDIIAVAQTGTGKTAAFLLPVINKILKTDNKGVNTVVICPTRELAIQIDQQAQGLGYFAGVTSFPVYGGGDGTDYVRQKNALKGNTDILICTPGRLLSLLIAGEFDFSDFEHLILDEADRMLDMGFYDDIMQAISYFPEKRQTLLFSATMPPKIRKMSTAILTDPARVDIAISKPAEGILQMAYDVNDNKKLDLITSLMQGKQMESVLIFASTKQKVKDITAALSKLGFDSSQIHSDLEQEERNEVLRLFKQKRIKYLVATDILSRGIDIKGIDLVINYDVPQDPEDYIHRIGRTARANSEGVAITFINRDDKRKFGRIEKLMEKQILKQRYP